MLCLMQRIKIYLKKKGINKDGQNDDTMWLISKRDAHYYTVFPNRSAGLNNLSCFSKFQDKMLRHIIDCKLTQLLLNIELV